MSDLEELDKQLNSMIPKVQAIIDQRDRLAGDLIKARKIIHDIAPFVLESYYPNFATPAFKAAAESLIEFLEEDKK